MSTYHMTTEYLQSIAADGTFLAADGTFLAAEALSNLFRALELDGSHCSHPVAPISFLTYAAEPKATFLSYATAATMGQTAAPVQYPHLRGAYTPRYLRDTSISTSAHNEFVTAVAMVILCLVCAGLASGLTQGLLSLDLMEMTIKSRSGTAEEKIYAAKVLPVISRHHLLLVTLMLWNASATEALPVFLSCLMPEYLAIIFAVTMVLFVGEIIPAAILTGPKQLQIAASLIPLVYLVNVVFFPVAYPISLVLDYVLGHTEGMTVYTKKEIATLMIIQHEEVCDNHDNHGIHLLLL
jgi:hypothetical protein